MTSRPTKPELLCPAGNFDAMRAAVANGADAVYFGLPAFNARHRAENFTLDGLPDVMRYLHRHNVKGFVTFNVLIFSDELPQAVEYIKAMAAAGVDAVIVQDLGVARLIHRLAPQLHVHASTQMTLTEPRGIAFARKLGVNRVVLAREMSVAEIAKVTQATDMPVEVFVHGALCVAYSGQCLTSESLGGRSANRGQCAQACRMPYDLVVDGADRALPDDIKYLVSPTDLGGWDAIGDLTAANVASFKIEGRLKSAHYVASTAQVYRRAIDKAVDPKGDASSSTDNRQPTTDNSLLTPREIADLSVVYTRGFTSGFLRGVDHQQLVPGRFPKARGQRVGTLIRTTGRGFVVELDAEFAKSNELRPGDGIVFDEGHPESDEAHGHVYKVDLWNDRNRVTKSIVLHVELGNRDSQPRDVTHGAIVWKNHDPQVEKQLERSFERDRVVHREPVDVTLHSHVGTNAKLTITDGTHTATAEYAQALQAAQKFPISHEAAVRQLDRFLDTPFALRTLTLDAQGGPMVPNSILADLRRRATDDLIEMRHEARVVRVEAPTALETARAEISSWHGRLARDSEETRAGRPCHAELHVLVRTMDQLDEVLRYRATRQLGTIYADFEDVRRYKDAVQKCRDAGAFLAVATMRIIKPGEEGWLQQILKCEPDAILVRNLAGIGFFSEFAPHLPLFGDYSLNVANELTAQILLEANLVRMVPSYDLSWNQMAAMCSRFVVRSSQQGDASIDREPRTANRELPFECVVHQHMPMFHMEHCVFAHTLSEGKDYRDCGRPCERHAVDLRDAKGKEHPLIPDAGCRNTLFNSDAQSALDYLPRMRELGITHFRVELLRQSADEVGPLLDQYLDVLEDKVRAKQALRSLKVVAQLGVTSGTFDRE
jgi:putative protease